MMINKAYMVSPGIPEAMHKLRSSHLAGNSYIPTCLAGNSYLPPVGTYDSSVFGRAYRLTPCTPEPLFSISLPNPLPCRLLFLLFPMTNPMVSANTVRRTAPITPTPMPTFAPKLRPPDEDGRGDAGRVEEVLVSEVAVCRKSSVN